MNRISKVITGMLVFSAGTLNLQAQVFTPGDITVSAGYGFPSLTKTIFNIADGTNVSTMFIGPVFAKAEMAMTETVGLGLDVAYTYGNATYQTGNPQIDSLIYNSKFKYQSYSILGRVNFHFGHGNNIDPYAGVGFGYRNAKYTYTGNDPNASGTDLNGFIHFGMDFTMGMRVYLTNHIGVYGEVGIAKAPIQVGLVAKF